MRLGGTPRLAGLDDTPAAVGDLVRAEGVATDGIALIARPLS